MIWQLQWQYALLPLSLIVAMAFDSESRTQFLWAYKLRNIEEGKLHYREGWGWVDDSHYHDHRLKELLHKIETAPAGKPLTITIHEPFVTIIRKWLPVERKYEIFDPKKLDEQERWAVASGISLHFSNENELAQGAVPSWMCSQMSVYQFDDLPTTLLTCLDKAPRQSPTKVPIGEQNIERLIERWDAEGDNLVRSNHQQLRLPEEASQEHQRLFGQIHLSNEHWRFAGIGKGDYSMVR